MNRSSLMAALLLLAAAAWAQALWADGFVLPQAAARFPDMPVQRALVRYLDGVETLAIEAAFEGEGERFGWVIPIPAVPSRLAEMTPGFLKTLAVVLQPEITHYHWREYFWWIFPGILGFLAFAAIAFRSGALLKLLGVAVVAIMAFLIIMPNFISFKSAGAPQGSVKVVSRQTIGNYETAVLQAKESMDLNRWLSDNGFRAFPEGAGPVIEDYIRSGWCFVAARLLKQREGAAVPHPILVEFPTQRPVYPMRLTALSGSRLDLEVFVVAAREAVPEGYALKKAHCDTYFMDQHWNVFASRKFSRDSHYERVGLVIGHPRVGEILWDGCVVTRLTGSVSAKAMTRDLYFSLKDPTPYHARAFSKRGAFLHALFWAVLMGWAGGLLAGAVHWAVRGREVRPARTMFGALGLVGLLTFAILYLRADKVDFVEVRPSQMRADSELEYEWEARLIMREEPSLESGEELIAKLKHHRNPFTGEPLMAEDSPGNLTLERLPGFGPLKLLKIYGWNGAPLPGSFRLFPEQLDSAVPLLDLLEQKEDFWTRATAMRALCQFEGEEVLTALMRMLQDRSPQQRVEALQCLATKKDPRITPAAIPLLKDGDSRVREHAADALGIQGDMRAIEPLIEALGDTSQRVSSRAVDALRRIGAKKKAAQAANP